MVTTLPPPRTKASICGTDFSVVMWPSQPRYSAGMASGSGWSRWAAADRSAGIMSEAKTRTSKSLARSPASKRCG
ncbi:hypothetical protein D3C85_565220 [compost metagenome]